MEKNKLTVSQTLEFAKATNYLEDLLQSFKTGTILVSLGEESLELTPAPFVKVEVAAKVKKGRQKFSLELAWDDTGERPLVISGAAEAVAAASVRSEPVKDPEPAPAAEAAPCPAPAAEKVKPVESETIGKGEAAPAPAGQAAAGKEEKAKRPGNAAKKKPLNS